MVVVDTSVWVSYLRDAKSPVDEPLEHLLDADEALLVGPVMFELLRGSRSSNEYEHLSDWLNELPFQETTAAVWTQASSLSYLLRTSGITVGMADALIATVAMMGNHEVFSWDTDFDRIPGLALFRLRTDP